MHHYMFKRLFRQLSNVSAVSQHYSVQKNVQTDYSYNFYYATWKLKRTFLTTQQYLSTTQHKKMFRIIIPISFIMQHGIYEAKF